MLKSLEIPTGFLNVENSTPSHGLIPSFRQNSHIDLAVLSLERNKGGGKHSTYTMTAEIIAWKQALVVTV